MGAFPITPKELKKVLQTLRFASFLAFSITFKTLHTPVTRGGGVLEILTWDRFQLQKERRGNICAVSGESVLMSCKHGVSQKWL